MQFTLEHPSEMPTAQTGFLEPDVLSSIAVQAEASRFDAIALSVGASNFAATGPMWLASPKQRPHPPVWIGGNSTAARRRVIQYGQGWCPVIGPRAMAASVRTATIDTPERFGQAVARLHTELDAAGRDPSGIDIQVEVPVIDFDDDGAVRRAVDDLAELERFGATWAIAHIDAESISAATEYISAFTENVLRPWHDRSAVGTY
jgi:alkanesulfonate monooxygenase SsuD/methylene tetrahydromethanopterin reductase-like flavin-dependent oxidoreductase (luciferase family)